MSRTSSKTLAGTPASLLPTSLLGRAKPLVAAMLAFAAATAAHAEPLRVCATVPELGSLVREIGGEEVSVAVFGKPTEDPHFIEAKPSFIKELSKADLYVQSGLELEMGWAPTLLQNANNPRILPGRAGFLDASVVVTPVEVPPVPVDRSMGDVHPFGNPHYLLDPINGLKVAALIRDRLGQLRIDRRPYFASRFADFESRLREALVGAALAKQYEAEKLALLYERGKLSSFLESQGQVALLGGWFGLLQSGFGTKAVDDHNIWPYFAHRFGVTVVGHLEPKPGIPPTTRHLQEVVQLMRAEDVKVVLAAAYYDPRHAEFVARETGAKVVRMANQAGSRPGTESYLGMIDYNVRELAKVLAAG